MADSKITALAALTAADPVNDMFPVVDVSDTSMAASGTTKRISVNNILSSSPTASGALTVTGLVTAGSASITGALTVDTTTLVANAAGYTDKVGVGTATPAATLHIKGSGRVDGDYNLFDFYKDNGSTRLGYLLFRDDGANYLNVNSNQPLYLSTNNTVQVQVETSGDVKINTGNLVMGTSGKGIDFSATSEGSGTMTSEILNDYEEGTFTPTMLGTTLAGVGVYGTQVGFYTKIGNVVTVQAYLDWTAHTATGSMRLGGLPFTTNSTANSISSVTFGFINNIALTASNLLMGYTSTGNTFIDLYQYPTGGGAASAVSVDTAGGIGYNVTYRV